MTKSKQFALGDKNTLNTEYTWVKKDFVCSISLIETFIFDRKADQY